MNEHIVWFVCLCGVFMQSACVPSGARNERPFRGEWVETHTNGITDMTDQETVRVATDGIRFRITRAYTTMVFDGTTLFSVPHAVGSEQAAEYGSSENAAPLPQGDATAARQYTFWKYGGGLKVGPGGLVAGRQTTFYEGIERRPDGEMSVQSWVDAETGVVLKKTESIYSSQVNSLVMSHTLECASISYEAVNEGEFACRQK